MRRQRKKSLIMAVARPDYASVEPATVELAQLRKGAKGDTVKALQLLLVGRGFSCGQAGADSSFGSATDAAVRAYQSKKGLTVDGIVGKNTWSKLLGV
jgi:peptidoglycan hydrolase-like protein with peptidoglycan-binding domain